MSGGSIFNFTARGSVAQQEDGGINPDEVSVKSWTSEQLAEYASARHPSLAQYHSLILEKNIDGRFILSYASSLDDLLNELGVESSKDRFHLRELFSEITRDGYSSKVSKGGVGQSRSPPSSPRSFAPKGFVPRAITTDPKPSRVVATATTATDNSPKDKVSVMLQQINNMLCVREDMQKHYDTLEKKQRQKIASVTNNFMDLVELAPDIFHPDMRQQALDGTTVKSVSELYAAAEKAKETYSKALVEILKRNGVDCATAQQKGFVEHQNIVYFAPLKRVERAEEKAKDAYDLRQPGPGIAWVHDVVRASIESVDLGVAQSVLETFMALEEERLQVVRIKNRFGNPAFNGFSDALISLRLQVKGPEGKIFYHICELQLTVKMINIQSKTLHSYRFYEIYRTYLKGHQQDVDAKLSVLVNVNKVLIFPKPFLLPHEQYKEAGIRQRQLQEAEMLNPQGLNAKAKSEDKLDHLRVAVTALESFGELEWAIDLQREIIVRCEKSHSRQNWHRDTLDAETQLAYLLFSKGAFDESKEVFQKAIEGREARLGVGHSDTLATVNALGNLLFIMANHDESKVLLKRAFDDRLKALGQKNLDYQSTAINYAAISLLQGAAYVREAKLAVAKIVVDGKVEDNLMTFLNKDDDPDLLWTAHSLAYLMENLRPGNADYEMARKLYTHALSGYVRIFSTEHPATLKVASSLGSLELKQDNVVGATALLSRALAGQEKALGHTHRDTITTAAPYATILQRNGELEKAEELYRRVLRGKRGYCPQDSMEIQESVVALAKCLRQEGKDDEARSLYETEIRDLSKRFGPEHRSVLYPTAQYGYLLNELGEIDSAKTALYKALNGYERIFGPNDPEIMNILLALFSVLEAKGEAKEMNMLFKKYNTPLMRAKAATIADVSEKIPEDKKKDCVIC